MKVIFLKDVKNQGKKNEVKEVKDGYGMNFLIKKGYAVAATESSVNKLKKENSEKKLQENLLIKDMEVIKNKLEKEKFVFKVKTGKSDRMFGQISAKQIKSEIEKKGYKIDKNSVMIDHPITCLGSHIVELELHKKVIANITITVEKES